MNDKILYWAPRVLAILFTLFISVFAFDVFGGGYGFPKVLLALLMHLIPSFVLLIILAVSWKWELAGAIAWIVLGFGFTIFFKTYSSFPVFALISGPVFVVGLLFLSSWYNKGKKR